jgi:hypothetical protein
MCIRSLTAETSHHTRVAIVLDYTVQLHDDMYFLRCGTTAFKQQSFNTAETMLSL